MNSYWVQEKVKIRRQDGLELINLQDTFVAEKPSWRKKGQRPCCPTLPVSSPQEPKMAVQKHRKYFLSCLKMNFDRAKDMFLESTNWRFLATKQQRQILKHQILHHRSHCYRIAAKRWETFKLLLALTFIIRYSEMRSMKFVSVAQMRNKKL